MVAVIKSGTSVRRTFYYNENKVKEGVATLLLAANYPIDQELLTENQRLNMLMRTAEKYPEVKRNSLHISLNFSPDEQLDDTLLSRIAREYMEQIGFAEQPYLVYKHADAGHPHIHIATVIIRPDGTRIDTFGIGRRLSEPARKDIEQRYNLVRAEEQRKVKDRLNPLSLKPVQYGTSDTRRAISNVLSGVLDTYKFTSLGELNAVLNLYNIQAETGEDGSRIKRHRGLVFRVLDPSGKPVGTPIKASLFATKPTLGNLEKKFLKHGVAREQFKNQLKAAIDKAVLFKQGSDPKRLIAALERSGIQAIIRVNAEGRIYGITYIDHRSKCVFNGSALGKNYSAKGLLDRLELAVKDKLECLDTVLTQPVNNMSKQDESVSVNQTGSDVDNEKGPLATLLQAEYDTHYLPYELRKIKKKNKKKRPNNL